jgi:hypothetical protein
MCVLALVICTPGATGAQPAAPRTPAAVDHGSIVGTVKTGAIPAAGASVVILSPRRGARAGPDGSFRFDDLPPGPLQLRINLLGCPSTTADVIVTAGEEETVQIELECLQLFCRDRANVASPGCFVPNPFERARVGQPCRVHPNETLAADTVRIVYGFENMPGTAERDLFPNAGTFTSGGCIVGQAGFGEVAFCGACRRMALERQELRYGEEQHRPER